jgi:hypothetical protein
MVRRATEPEQEITLTGATNQQAFPARVSDDAAQEDNRRRVAAAKEADYSRTFLPGQREALGGDTVVLVDRNGVRVRTAADNAERLLRVGYRTEGAEQLAMEQPDAPAVE